MSTYLGVEYEASSQNPESKWVGNYAMVLVCKECKEYPANIVEDNVSGDTICSSCGLVLGEHMIDTRPEWRTFAGDDETGADPNRCGDAASSLLDGNQLDTAIAFLPSSTGKVLARAHRSSHQNTTNKILLAAYSDIGAYCESMGLTGMVADATKEYFKKAFDSKTVRGRDNVTVIASCLFLACRRCDVARTFHEVMAITKCPKKELARTFKVLSKLFQNEEAGKEAALAKAGIPVAQSDGTIMTSGGTAQSIIPRICSNLQLSHRSQQIAVELMNEVQRQETLGGRTPNTKTAVVVYAVSHLNNDGRSLQAVSDQCGIAPSTVLRAYRTFYKQRTKLVNPERVLGGIDFLPKP